MLGLNPLLLNAKCSKMPRACALDTALQDMRLRSCDSSALWARRGQRQHVSHEHFCWCLAPRELGLGAVHAETSAAKLWSGKEVPANSQLAGKTATK